MSQGGQRRRSVRSLCGATTKAEAAPTSSCVTFTSVVIRAQATYPLSHLVYHTYRPASLSIFPPPPFQPAMRTFVSAVAVATVAVAAVVGSAGADLFPEVKLPAQAILDTYCDGTPIETETETMEYTSGTYDGNCTIALGERGEFKTGKYGSVTISGMLTVTTAASPRESELQVEEGSTLSAASMDLGVRELQVKKGATLSSTDGDLMVSALRQIQVEEMATMSAEGGSISLVAGREVQLKMMSTLTASDSITASAPKCFVEVPSTATAPEKNIC